MTTDPEPDLTDEEIQAEFLLRAVRAGAALQLAPELVGHIRARSHPDDGRTEAGFDLRSARTPLLTGVVDDADEVYTQLHGWVETFRGKRPGVAWVRRDGNVIGLPAHLSDRGAQAMTYVLTAWLLQRSVWIQDQPAAGDFYDEITATIWRLRSKHQLTRAVPTQTAVRACPTCGRFEVKLEYFGQPFDAAERRGEFDPVQDGTADERRDPNQPAGKAILNAVSGIDVRCAHCGWVGIPKASEILRWLA